MLTCQSNCATPIGCPFLLLVNLYIRIYGERHISYHNLWWHAMLCALPFDASFLMLLLHLPPFHPKYSSICCCLCCPSVNCCAHQFDVVNFVKIYRLLPSKFDIVMQFVSRIWMYEYEKQLTTLLVFPCCLDSKEIIQIRIQFDFFEGSKQYWHITWTTS